ncbi:MAG TPA: hypothetical protein VMT70_05840 [Vicinamibacteria bacterium]|nr:hypothetical protein [Vicinamibacteria bacterium]
MGSLALAFLLLGPGQDEAEALRLEVNRLKGEVSLLQSALHERDALLGTVREELVGAREDVRDLKERPQPVAAPFLAAPPPSSDKLGVARTALFAPRVDVESFLRHDTVVLKLRRVEAGSVRNVAELELTPDASGVDLPIDQSGALYLVEWSTSEGHFYNLLLRDGASGQPAASVPVKEKQSEGRFAFVGYRVD